MLLLACTKDHVIQKNTDLETLGCLHVWRCSNREIEGAKTTSRNNRLTPSLSSSHWGVWYRMLWGFPGSSDSIKNLPAMRETQVPSLRREDPLEKGMAPHFSILAWEFVDKGAWRATVHGVAKSWTQLSDFPILLFSSISLRWLLRKAFLSLFAILWNSSFKWVYRSFSPLPLASRCKSAALNMPENLENLAVATGLEKVSFHYNTKERQCQRMLKLPHNCTHLTR